MAEDVSGNKVDEDEVSAGILSNLLSEIITSPLNLFLLSICFVLLYKIYKSSRAPIPVLPTPTPTISKLKKQDMSLDQLKKYDGTNEDSRVCIAVNGKIFDVTRGKNFYGPGGPYSAFAGHDATRALATFSVNNVIETFDDISDLSSLQMDSVREWEMQMNEKYDYIGHLLKPGEEGIEYSDDDEKDKSPKKED